ncbi:LuxR family transcriptional regulator [Chryseobacterium arthrosphaerae]|uniref:LuxR C-terminal-related transcriptional regulator n=1 Tax=Chryseobacterium arthrosphaerae TaxID=651561 RepID=UPI000F5138F0|nr:LuxR C-terminal-related transcriptional regulator [Chryseobacterium arthrosphaerae]AYZ13885.1 LuxR family transcriptional regulator [Chryseobacterium arthrosphaerae]
MKKKINPIDENEFYDHFAKNGELPENYFDFFADSIESVKSFPVGPYFWFITNNIEMRTKRTSENIELFTPYSKEQWINSDTTFFMNLFHPQDRRHIMAAFVFSATLRLKLLKEGKTEVRFNYYGRMINRNHEYRWVLLQSPLQIINNDEIKASFVVVYDLSHFIIQNLPLLSIIDLTNNEAQYFKHVDQQVYKKINMEKPKITKREKEVLNLMAQGFNSPEIAEKLFLSYHTVENHKRNLRKKTNTKTSAELIAYTINHSLLVL